MLNEGIFCLTSEYMRARTKKLLNESQFSEVDEELSHLHETILKNCSLHILESSKTKYMPFQAIQEYLHSQGKQLCMETLGILAKK
jgi:hypothetical protein